LPEASRQELLSIIGHMCVAVFRADGESRLLAVNVEGAQLLGASPPSELQGRPVAYI
jgi:PAS domain-containing protein